MWRWVHAVRVCSAINERVGVKAVHILYSEIFFFKRIGEHTTSAFLTVNRSHVAPSPCASKFLSYSFFLKPVPAVALFFRCADERI
jgi:hypothetical protein